MKAKIHPNYKEVQVNCSCGNSFVTRSAAEKKSLIIEVCSQCHPFYTGLQKLVDTGGRVDKFKQKYTQKPAAAQATAPVTAKATSKAKKEKTKSKPKVSRKLKVAGQAKEKKEAATKPSKAKVTVKKATQKKVSKKEV